MDTKTTLNPAKVVPLLQALSTVEELTSSLAVRLDPIVMHVPTQNETASVASTVTGRLIQIGDALQYLLDHIEL